MSLVNTDDSSAAEVLITEELADIESTFRTRINEINEEMKLLQNHTTQLKNSLDQIDSSSDVTIRRTGNNALRRYSTRLLISLDRGQTYKGLKSVPLCGITPLSALKLESQMRRESR